jgi:hypothetical protein
MERFSLLLLEFESESYPVFPRVGKVRSDSNEKRFHLINIFQKSPNSMRAFIELRFLARYQIGAELRLGEPIENCGSMPIMPVLTPQQ